MTQNSISMRSEAQTPKNRRKNTKTPAGFGLGAKIAVSVRNRFCPLPAKADIATADINKCVIEHLVLLFPPNKHAFTAKAVWADFLYLSLSLLAFLYMSWSVCLFLYLSLSCVIFLYLDILDLSLFFILLIFLCLA